MYDVYLIEDIRTLTTTDELEIVDKLAKAYFMSRTSVYKLLSTDPRVLVCATADTVIPRIVDVALVYAEDFTLSPWTKTYGVSLDNIKRR